VVLAEAPSYEGALGAFTAYLANVVHVAMDDDGLTPEALSTTLASLAARGRSAMLWREQIKELRELYRGRRDATLEALTTLMPPGCRWTTPAAWLLWCRDS
jgi:DNA-binding transcriptional MocR family regulator